MLISCTNHYIISVMSTLWVYLDFLALNVKYILKTLVLLLLYMKLHSTFSLQVLHIVFVFPCFSWYLQRICIKVRSVFDNFILRFARTAAERLRKINLQRTKGRICRKNNRNILHTRSLNTEMNLIFFLSGWRMKSFFLQCSCAISTGWKPDIEWRENFWRYGEMKVECLISSVWNFETWTVSKLEV